MIQLFKKTITVPIDEIFFSYQGEAVYAGLAQIFVRFAGCNIKCSYCDTPISRKINRKTKKMSADEILKSINALSKKNKCRHISFTGGEPLIYADFLKDFLPKLKKKNFKIYLETNGTLPDKLKKIIKFCDIVSMDFKLPSHCGQNFWKKHREFLKSAGKKAFVKIVIAKTTKRAELKKASEIIKKINKNIPLILQPSLNKDRPKLSNLFQFYETTSKQISNVRIMPQLHKIFKVR
ncbi:MAG: 7-carboxy-7-deazaguanine synthase QueE [Elusimicrobiota bacterium]|jgi:organic radical activating enzyme|nr:7-carboxy-7-deazaguanine synthase QueE [Elusimicrobiota bacterium]